MYNGMPCGIFDNIGNDPGSGRFVICGEPGDDVCELLFRDSRSGALYRGQEDGKTIRLNHREAEEIDESLRRLDLRTLHWLRNGNRLNSNTGYDTINDIENRNRFYNARATISDIEAILESGNDLSQETIDNLNEELEKAKGILEKARNQIEEALANTFV